MRLLSADPDLYRDLSISYSENDLPVYRVAALNHAPADGPRRRRQTQLPFGEVYRPRRGAAAGNVVAKLPMRPDQSPGRCKNRRVKQDLRPHEALTLRKGIVGRRHKDQGRRDQGDTDRKFAQVYHLGQLTGST